MGVRVNRVKLVYDFQHPKASFGAGVFTRVWAGFGV
jgi:hypothetical protein